MMVSHNPTHRLGKHLVERGAISPGDLDEALQSQVVYGGRLGTNLVELGYLSLDDLATHLAELTGTPLPPPAWVEQPDTEAIKAIPADLAERHQVLPLRLEHRTLHLAMLDPTDSEKIEELSFVSSMAIRPYVLPELRLLYALEVHIGVDRDLRFVDLAERPERGDVKRVRPNAPVTYTPGEGEDVIDERSFPARLEPAGEEEGESTQPSVVIGDEEAGREARAGFSDDTPLVLPGIESDPAGSAGLPALEAALASSPDRDAVARNALAVARAHASTTALFVVHRDRFVCVGSNGLEPGSNNVVIPRDDDSTLPRVVDSGEPLRISPGDAGTELQLPRLLGRNQAAEILLLPVAIRGRVVNLLYVDNGTVPLAETSVAALGRLIELVAGAYENLILQRKQRGV